jgi:hypothetical protein
MLKIKEYRNRWIWLLRCQFRKNTLLCSLSRNFSFFYLMASFELLLHHFTCSWYGVGSGENDGSGENAGETTEKHENWD